MKPSKKHLDKIEEALIAVYRKQEDPQFPPDWRQQVMQDISSMAGPTAFPQEKKIRTMIPRRIGVLAGVALAAIVGWLILANLDWYDPWITLKPDLAALESHGAFWLEAGDIDSGLRSVKVIVVQKEVRAEVLSKDLEPPGGIWAGTSHAVKKADFPLEVDAQALGLHEGKATIVVTVRDLSWRNWFKGRATTLKREMVIYYKKSP
ncbi:MAG: hypothetical protein WBV23_12885 [Desulfobaccales bacterium]